MKILATITILTTCAALTAAQSGSGTTTRYWDCCKPSCSWPGKASSGAVGACDVHDQPLTDVNAKSGCEGGSAYMCSSQSPWAVSDSLAYGFTAVSGSNPTCCQCYQLTFTSGPVSGKKMIVQATNTGGDVGATQFDLAVFSPPSLYVLIAISNNIHRSQAVASESSTAVPQNGARSPRSGGSNTVVRPRIHALNFHRPCRPAVASAGTG